MEEDLEVDLVVTLSVMEAKVLYLFFSQNIENLKKIIFLGAGGEGGLGGGLGAGDGGNGAPGGGGLGGGGVGAGGGGAGGGGAGGGLGR